ncbi:MAG: rod shape-determining protein RodA [bacterium]|nr:rod shape-determining protein RodA [bacterium]
MKKGLFGHIDWILVGALVPLVFAGLVTMNTFSADNYFFFRQLMWVGVSLGFFFTASYVDWRFLRHSHLIVITYGVIIVLLLLLFFMSAVNGSERWILLPGFSLQPSDFMKVALIALLAKYFSRRHIEIARLRHIIVSGLYAFIPFVLVALQPDLGTAAVFFFIWLAMIIFAGVPFRYLAIIGVLSVVAGGLLWQFGLDPYQKNRVFTFIDPWSDVQGAGYNALQSQIAVGSGQVVGKGVGFGTQSRLEFLPEYETDFIFAAFAEEWGFIGVMILFVLYGIVFVRLTQSALVGQSNFESLFILGYGVLVLSHLTIHVGMNIGIMPITGITLPFISYGGSHMVTEFIALGIIMGMRRYSLLYSPFVSKDIIADSV